MKMPRLTALLIAMIFLMPSTAGAGEPDRYAVLRAQMVREQIVSRGVEDPRVLAAMEKVPRHLFVPENLRAHAYRDHPLPIGLGQTISQPYIVAFMTEALDLKPTDRVLEIGTGSGYQAAILGELVKEVYTIEIIETLGLRARRTLDAMGYGNIRAKIGDGYRGWPSKAPFDAVIVTCAPEEVPQALVRQLKEGGRLIIPVGRAGGVQSLVKAVKKGGRLEQKEVMAVRFVPMVRGKD
jgi:protein-L-isoaspartate(D-aspartate) O-methyltransferase